MIMNDENDDNKELLRCLRTDVEEVEKDMALKRKEKGPAVLKKFSLFLCVAVLVVVSLILAFSAPDEQVLLPSHSDCRCARRPVPGSAQAAAG